MGRFKTIINHFRSDHLYRNSIYLIASSGVMAGFGFFFWVIAAKNFTTDQIGVATTLLSVSSLISGFCMLGLNISLNRFLPKSEVKNEMISSSSILITFVSLIVCIIFLIGINIFSPKLSFLNNNLIYISTFIFFTIVISLNSLLDYIFTAYRDAGNVLSKSLILSTLKILFLFIFSAFGAYGLFSAFSLAMAISFFFGLGILIYKFKFHLILGVNIPLIKSMGKFSSGNYIANLLSSTPLLILPILIVNSIGATYAAYYYIDIMIYTLLLTIPSSVSQSLLTEGSHDETELKKHILKASKITFLLLIPSVIIIFFFGNYILHFFGKNFEEDAFKFLQIISISALFVPVSLFTNSILRIRHKINALIILNFIGASAIIISTYLLSSFGLVGIGWGILIGQAVGASAYLIYYLIFNYRR